MSNWREQQIGNETDSREINEWIEGSGETERSVEGDGGTPKTQRYVCECSEGGCRVMITLTRAEYEEVRAHATHFAIARDHESPDLDAMVSERERFTVVRKLPGLPARLAIDSDPRRTDPGS